MRARGQMQQIVGIGVKRKPCDKVIKLGIDISKVPRAYERHPMPDHLRLRADLRHILADKIKQAFITFAIENVQLIDQQSDLVEVVHTLRQVVCVCFQF